ncbi:MAG: FliA/WhiG family RNA polymerase sigma factor [Christensenellales bacterium]
MSTKQSAEQLWQKYAAGKTLENKNELVLHYLPQVKSIVLRLMPVYKAYSNYDDMLSCGIIGLMDAVEKYDLKRDVKFEYYAAMRIRGEIIDNIRKQDWAPSSLRRKIKAISQAYYDLENRLNREPTDKEVADYLNIDESDLHSTLGKSQMFNIIHFEELMQNDIWELNIQSQGLSLEEEVENREMIQILGDLIDNLPEKERLVVTLYYYEEMTLKEVASVLGVSESRISQIHSKAVMRLRSKLLFAGAYESARARG